MTILQFPYGKNFINVKIPIKSDIILSKPVDSLRNVEEDLEAKMRKPIGSKPLYDFLHERKKICIIVPDKTRNCHQRKLVPIIVKEVERCRPQDVKLLIANGLHSSMTREEIIEVIGEDIVQKYDVMNHVPNDRQQLIDFKSKTSYGTPLIVNRIAAESDCIIALGLVEPHFFAGYCGGRKAILPGITGTEAVFNNHSYKMIDNPNSTYGILDGNPIHQDMIEFISEFMKLADLPIFIVNITINSKMEITNIFTGNSIIAHKAAVSYLENYAKIRIGKPADIVIVSNGGFPLDRNLYQTVKGIATANGVVRKGGVIIMMAECKEGLGGHENFKTLMQKTSPQEVLEEIKASEPIPDQWQAQILANVLKKAKVILVTEGVSAHVIKQMQMEPANSFDEAMNLAKKICGVKSPRVAAIPEGPYTIPTLTNG